MAQERFKRKLSAIVSADVVGYSSLMTEDEIFTIQTLKNYRNLMKTYIERNSGRVVDAVGDNLLAEFSSAVDAVDCAVKIQKELKDRNLEFPENKRLNFRIGVNIGDVIQDGDRIFGDGVNIASRIEGLADAGGVCVSRGTYEQIKNKLPLSYNYLGEHEVKNIKEPVSVYKVLLEPSDGNESIDSVPLKIPDKPSIAVLPFNNMSGDPNQEFLSDGLTEQIITGISNIPGLFVIARNSTFAYKNKSVKVQQVAQELGVQFILEGSVQKSGDRVRINAQLIDASTGNHMWAETYDRVVEDIFAIQDDITIKLMKSLHDKLMIGEYSLHNEGHTQNLNAYIKFLKGLECFFRMTAIDNLYAQKCFKEAIAIDQNYSLSYAMLAYSHLSDVFHSWSKSPLESFEQAEKMAKTALSQVESLHLPLIVLSQIYLFMRQHGKAIEYGERAASSNPNNSLSYAMLALVLHYSGRPEEAISLLDKAFRLNPIAPFYYFHFLGLAKMNIGKYTEAIQAYKNAINLNPDFIFPYISLAACYIATGNENDARKALGRALRLNPEFSLDTLILATPHKDPAITEKIANLLRKAGLD